MSEALFLINPKRKRKKSRKGRMPAGLKRYWASRRAGKKTAKRRHKRRAVSVAAPRRKRRARATNPIRKIHRRRARRTNPIHRKRHRRSNPFSIKGLTHTIMPAAVGAAGALALDVALGYATPYLPASLQSGYVATAVKIAGAIGLGFGARKLLGREKGNAVTLGALTVVGYAAIKPLFMQFAPSVKLAGLGDNDAYGYAPDQGIGFYSPASVIQDSSGMGAYLPPRGMGAYLNPGMNGLHGDYSDYQPDWTNDKM